MKQNIFNFTIAAAVAAIVSIAPAAAQQSLESEKRLNGETTRQVFEPQRAVLQTSSAVLYNGYKRLVYGAVMTSDGWIMTKASEITEFAENLSVRVDKQFFDKDVVKVVAVDSASDLALVKIEAKDLIPVKWAKSSDIAHGTWVVSNGVTSRQNRRARAGIISARSRPIKGPIPVVLGLMLSEKGGKVSIGAVTKDTGSAQAGLKKGDVIVKVGEKQIKKREEILDILREKSAGDVLDVTYLRDGKEAVAKVKLTSRPQKAAPASRNDQMSGRFSPRRDGFEKILQHDILLQRHSCGGPLLNLEGEAVGLNIAYANRAERFALPVEAVLKVYEQLKSKAK